MGKALRRLKAALGQLQTGWSIVGITLVLLVLVEGGFRMIFALRDRMTAVPVPDPRVVAEGYGGAAWPVDSLSRTRAARRALAALRLLPAEAVSGRDDHHRRRRPAIYLAIVHAP